MRKLKQNHKKPELPSDQLILQQQIELRSQELLKAKERQIKLREDIKLMRARTKPKVKPTEDDEETKKPDDEQKSLDTRRSSLPTYKRIEMEFK